MVRECPVTHNGRPCGGRVAAGKLMCSWDWSNVPKALQTPVYRYWSAWNKTHADEDWQSYMLARTAALNTVST